MGFTGFMDFMGLFAGQFEGYALCLRVIEHVGVLHGYNLILV